MPALIYTVGVLFIGILIGISIERSRLAHQPFKSIDEVACREPLR